ncbi:MAG: succinate dehydrogenase cytochrome b subunit [Bacteroidota bacterium]|nr:succinate dehydrogenase cytochrome b subunit [Bacteroidota bacterium]
MSWFTKAISSSLGRKFIMATTGLFLVFFLIGHVSGNLLLFRNDGGQAYNLYAEFMTTSPMIQVLRILTALSFIFHIIYSIILTRMNRKARPVDYKVQKPSANSEFSARNMGILGTLVLIFLVIHLRAFLFEMKFGEVPIVDYGEIGKVKDLYSVVASTFSIWYYSLFYVIMMVFLGFHLWHGFKSAFQTLGIHHKKYTPAIRKAGYAFAVIVPAVFAAMPLYFLIKSVM